MTRETFEIHLSGDGEAVRRACRPGMLVSQVPAQTILTTAPVDQDGLHGLLGRLTDFGIELLELGPARTADASRSRPGGTVTQGDQARGAGRASYEIRVAGAPSAAVLAALHQRASLMPRHVVVVVEDEEENLSEILSAIVVPGVEVERIRATPVTGLPGRGGATERSEDAGAGATRLTPR
jgi:hypothetical protein